MPTMPITTSSGTSHHFFSSLRKSQNSFKSDRIVVSSDVSYHRRLGACAEAPLPDRNFGAGRGCLQSSLYLPRKGIGVPAPR
jgi:hypothetical protein